MNPWNWGYYSFEQTEVVSNSFAFREKNSQVCNFVDATNDGWWMLDAPSAADDDGGGDGGDGDVHDMYDVLTQINDGWKQTGETTTLPSLEMGGSILMSHDQYQRLNGHAKFVASAGNQTANVHFCCTLWCK